MTTYRAGQKLRIEWPDGSAVEGTTGRYAIVVKYGDDRYLDAVVAERDGATVTVLSEPRPPEPTGLGAVVEAAHVHFESEIGGLCAGRYLIRCREGATANPWRCSRCRSWYPWDDLIDPVVLSEGWTP